MKDSKKIDKYDISMLVSKCIDTKLGSMLAIASNTSLYLLEFVNRHGFENEIMRMRQKLHVAIIPGSNDIIKQLERELQQYFEGKQIDFQTPITEKIGSPFQKKVWQQLRKIPAGTTISYKELAITIGNEKACRAVARANGTNQISILIPCHRVINSNGELGGYGGGLYRKQWLLDLEKNYRL